MLATQVLQESNEGINPDKDSDAQVVGILTAENKEHVIRKGENKIGRDPSVCLIVLKSRTVSKLHAIIESDGIDDTFIYDVGSTNQTKLGKKNLKPYCRYKIDDNSTITFGNVVAKFKTQNNNNEYKKGTVLDITPPFSGGQNNSSIYVNDDLFEHTTQMDFLQPSTSGETKKFKKSFEDSQIFKLPTQKNVTSGPKTSPESQNFFNAETQCQITYPVISPKESSSCDVRDSKIFNLSTECQRPKAFSQKLSREDVLKDGNNKNDNDLLNDGNDYILTAVSLKSPLNVSSEKDKSAIKDCNKEKKENEDDEDNQDQNHSSDESVLQFSLTDSEIANIIKFSEEPNLNVGDIVDSEDEETQQFNFEIYKKIFGRQSFIVEESSDEETQINSNKNDNENQRSDNDLIGTPPYDTKNSQSDKGSLSGNVSFEKPSDNDENKDFVCAQVFSDFREQDKKKDDSCDNKKNVENPIQNNNDEDFLATKLFSGPVNNFETINKKDEEDDEEEEEDLIGLEECEDLIATQMFSGPVNNFEKTKGKQKNSSMLEEIHEFKDFLDRQLFPQPINTFEKEEIKKNAAVEQTGSIQSVNKEDSQDFLATQIFPDCAGSGKKVPEKTFSNSETVTRENENLLETQLFPNPEELGSRNIKNTNTVEEEEDCEDFVATQIFDASEWERNSTPKREDSPDGLEFSRTQLFPADDSDVKTADETEKTIKKKFLNITQETSFNFNISDGDNKKSDLEVISDEVDMFTGELVSFQSCTDETPVREKSTDDVQSENSNSSYVFELENLKSKSKLNTTSTITETSKRESNLVSGKGSSDSKKSKTSFWECFSLEMLPTQDLEEAVKKVSSKCVEKSNCGDEKSKEVKINKRNRKNDCEGNEIPLKKSRMGNKSRGSDEKRLNKSTHDIEDIRTSTTRQTDKTAEGSLEKSDKGIRSEEMKAQEVQGLDDEFGSISFKKSLSPQIESNLGSFRRVLRSSREFRCESPVVSEEYSTTIRSNHKNVPCRKLRKSSRRKSGMWKVDGSCVNIVFTGFECELLEKIISELKGKKMEVLSVCDVLVADKVRRTVKFLCAMGLGLPITSPEWLLASKTENEFLNPWDFILKDKDSEEKWKFDLKNSLEQSRTTKLMSGMSVFATKNTKPPPQELLAIVECCGGVAITSHPEVWPENTIIASCLEDEDLWPLFKPSHVQIVHYECILSGVLTQKLDIKRFKLN